MTYLLLDLERQVKFDVQALIGFNADMAMYACILCSMVVSLKESIPFVISAIPITKILISVSHYSHNLSSE